MPDEAPHITPNVEEPRTREDAPPPPSSDRPKARGAGMAKLERQLAEFYETIAVIVVTPFDRLGGALLHKRAGVMAETWIDLAERDPRVKATLQRLMEASGWAGVVAAHMAIVIPVLANRGFFPDGVASGAATITIMQDPELAPLFTHERWTQHANNGNGASGQ